MAPLIANAALVLIVVVLASVLVTVERDEKYWFVGGVVAILVGAGLVGLGLLPGVAGGYLGLLGVLAVLWATVPLLRQSPTTS